MKNFTYLGFATLFSLSCYASLCNAQSTVPGSTTGITTGDGGSTVPSEGGNNGGSTIPDGQVGGGSTIPAMVPGIVPSPTDNGIVPSEVPGITTFESPDFEFPQGWQDFVNEDLPDVLTDWLMAIPELLQLFKGQPPTGG